ncbi:DUF420 domain-containing protein [Paenibacillus protaetiae]|uniref:DUF420 domain-containing protein n=1 Tax=Paenibacillus protaetiae TaxID=2509456 RepID=A0A4V0YFK7_9BACL|nr:DUF420 domain-containing protein [Paenibacillus protaetiae]QAY68051.1 DUF420 domain-containing protein [Paenibacillus protaetiae]
MSIYEIMPTISTAFIVISGILVAIGWRLAMKRQFATHERVMVGGAVTALLFFIVYISRTALVGNTSWGGPDWLKPYYMVFLLFHIVLATVAAVFGITTLLLAYNKRFAKHRRWGRITASIWLPTAFTGVVVYVLLYLMYPGGHTAPVYRAIFG